MKYVTKDAYSQAFSIINHKLLKKVVLLHF